ncbi:2-oxo-4-hydroxy-4-carboxy-5-ureidoimidazoline decarboxylase [Streptomyces sp. NRRL F-5126]|uniref:2-oxo-4-hydroxy-4-carboxy-5-ureidoimidazoline decarboxylase n=1 Tax=Streptomyces sp. NRRL F-5126 TaxID=1463857 RepID=UPI00099DB23A|nr:2-oxo-4-hydroxy-4-carboxy-5-ureidoimidazoline decarboxylase [Streptomyces sp. NRRL F-5126]
MTSPLARFNAASAPEALDALREVCAGSTWGGRLVSRRPYASLDALLDASDAATAALDDSGLDEAMAGHPPIGRPAPGDPVSAREQRGMAGASDALREELVELNLAYQERFGHVFLICATGASAQHMRDALAERLSHTAGQERAIARTELGRINRIRLTRLMAAPAASVSTHVLDTSAGRPAAGVPVALAARAGAKDPWTELGGSATDADGRCKDLPALPDDTTQVRLVFDTGAHLATTTPADPQQDAPALRDSVAFFPEVTVAFAVTPGEHYHVPLLLNPFGYSVYRGS